ncbi:MAG: hypothetical protein PVF56_15850, partial [Desulfobacterales bacterium]
DWRMPTVEELASILARRKKRGIHIDSVFDSRQFRCWTVDQCDPKSWSWRVGAWVIDFKNGEIIQTEYKNQGTGSFTLTSERNKTIYTKAVRAVK